MLYKTKVFKVYCASDNAASHFLESTKVLLHTASWVFLGISESVLIETSQKAQENGVFEHKSAVKLIIPQRILRSAEYALEVQGISAWRDERLSRATCLSRVLFDRRNADSFELAVG